LAKRKLDSIGFILEHFGILNFLERVKRMKPDIALADSLAQVFRAN
jgi:hypothetical protein